MLSIINVQDLVDGQTFFPVDELRSFDLFIHKNGQIENESRSIKTQVNGSVLHI